MNVCPATSTSALDPSLAYRPSPAAIGVLTCAATQSSAPGRQKDTAPSMKRSRGGVAVGGVSGGDVSPPADGTGQVSTTPAINSPRTAPQGSSSLRSLALIAPPEP